MTAAKALEVARGDVLAGAEAATPPLMTGPRKFRTIAFTASPQELRLSGLLGHDFRIHPAIVFFRARSASVFVGFKPASNGLTITASPTDFLEVTTAEGKNYWWIGPESDYIEFVGAGVGVLEVFVAMPVPGGQEIP